MKDKKKKKHPLDDHELPPGCYFNEVEEHDDLPVQSNFQMANPFGSLLGGGAPFGIGLPIKKKDEPKDDLQQNSITSLISHPEVKIDRRAETAPDLSPMLKKNRKR